MINHNNEAVLIDFGISALVNEQEYNMSLNTMGTYTFYSPEMWEKKVGPDGKRILSDGEMNDLWALGVTFYKMLAGVYPWDDTDQVMEMKEQILTKEIDFSKIKNDQARDVI